METRKQEEARFHDKIRGERLKENIRQYENLTSNKKFYSIARKSQKFVNDYLAENCFAKKVLDYCCGNGGEALFLAEKGAQVIGIDISPASIENARRFRCVSQPFL